MFQAAQASRVCTECSEPVRGSGARAATPGHEQRQPCSRIVGVHRGYVVWWKQIGAGKLSLFLVINTNMWRSSLFLLIFWYPFSHSFLQQSLTFCLPMVTPSTFPHAFLPLSFLRSPCIPSIHFPLPPACLCSVHSLPPTPSFPYPLAFPLPPACLCSVHSLPPTPSFPYPLAFPLPPACLCSILSLPPTPSFPYPLAFPLPPACLCSVHSLPPTPSFPYPLAFPLPSACLCSVHSLPPTPSFPYPLAFPLPPACLCSILSPPPTPFCLPTLLRLLPYHAPFFHFPPSILPRPTLPSVFPSPISNRYVHFVIFLTF